MLTKLRTLALLLFFVCLSAQAQVAFVQDDSGGANGSSTTIAVAFGNDTVTGNFFVLQVQWDGETTVTGVADLQSNTYTQSVTHTRGTEENASHFYAFNITGGTNTITVTFSGGSSFRRLAIHEYSGVQSASDPRDVVSSADGSSTNAASGTATTTQANNLIFGGLNHFSNVTVTAGTGFTLRIVQQSNSLTTENILDGGAAGSEEVTFSHATTEWICLMSTFFRAAVAAATPRRRVIVID